jgi:multiple sugar transport system substrate-binding protein
MHMAGQTLSRRSFLRGIGLAAAASVLGACSQPPVEVTRVVEKPVEVTKVVQETVQVTTVVEKPVEVTKVVEKTVQVVVTPTLPARVKLSFQFWDGEPYMSTIVKPSGQRYVLKHPNVTIDYQQVDWGEYMPKLLANLAAGTPTDVFWANLGEALPIVYRNPDLFLDPEPLLKQDSSEINLDDFWPTARAGSIYKGKYWGVCWGTSATEYLFFNKKLFADAGLKAPDALFDEGKWTWDAFLDAAIKLTKYEGNRPVQFGADSILGDQLAFGTLLVAEGGSYMDEALTKATLNGAEGVKALQFAADMHLKYKVSPGAADKDIPFAKTGKLGMRTTVDGFIPEWRTFTTLFDWDIAPPASGTKGWHSMATSNSYCMSKTGKNTAVAWDFVKHSMGVDEDLFYAEQYGWVPFRKANLQPWLKGMEKLAPPHNLKYFEPVQTSAIYHPLSPVWGSSGPHWTNEVVDPILAGGNVDVKKLADTWVASVNKLIAELK